MSGYVRLYRDLLDHPAFRNDAEAMAFAWLFARASWKDTRIRYKGRPVELKRGQLAISVRDIAAALDRDKAWIERLFKRLKSETMITVTSETGVSLVTICNYDRYQASSEDGETVHEALCETPNETDARQRRDTEQIREEVNIYTPLSPPKGKALKTPLPEDWQVPSLAELGPKARQCAEQWTRASYETQAEAFSCHFRSATTKKADWTATWCNWIIRGHGQVMRDQKFGNAPIEKAETKHLEPDEVRESHLKRAKFYDKIGRSDDAEECRSLAAQVGVTKPPGQRSNGPKPIGSLIKNMSPNLYEVL